MNSVDMHMNSNFSFEKLFTSVEIYFAHGVLTILYHSVFAVTRPAVLPTVILTWLGQVFVVLSP